MSREFNHDEKKILFTIFEHLPGTGEVSMFELQSSSALERTQRFGVYKLISEPPLTVLCSLTSKSPTVFLTITEHNALELVPALSSIEKSDREMPFVVNEYVDLEDPYLKKAGQVGAILVSPTTSPILAGFPEQINVPGSRSSCLLVVFITHHDHLLLQENGTQTLLPELLQKRRGLAL